MHRNLCSRGARCLQHPGRPAGASGPRPHVHSSSRRCFLHSSLSPPDHAMRRHESAWGSSDRGRALGDRTGGGGRGWGRGTGGGRGRGGGFGPAPPTGPIIEHPFEADANDHCETPREAYADVAPVLKELARLMGKTPETLRIYDPYFCAGGVKNHLRNLGFPNVHNVCEDFYACIEAKATPEFDVLVTNPPYSTKPIDHIERLMAFCASQRRPYLILQPCYVYTKEYYKAAAQDPAQPFYLTPSRRYLYRTPKGLRDIPSNQLKTSPFVTFWFCDAGGFRDELVSWWCASGKDECSGSHLRCNTDRLPQRYKDSHDPTRRRLRKKQREAIGRRKRLQAGGKFVNTKQLRRKFNKNRPAKPHASAS